MQGLVVYSSLTGNTKMVAEAIAEELGGNTVLAAVEENPSAADYDFIAVGYWVDKGTADAKSAAYLGTIKNKKVALFATLGADPASEHAKQSLESGAALLDASNEVVGQFICQGKVDPKLIATMAKMFPANHPHGMNEERKARHEMASTHPDANDLLMAKAVFKEVKRKVQGV